MTDGLTVLIRQNFMPLLEDRVASSEPFHRVLLAVLAQLARAPPMGLTSLNNPTIRVPGGSTNEFATPRSPILAYLWCPGGICVGLCLSRGVEP